MSANHDFGAATSLRPESIGEPGNRIFRLIIDGWTNTAVVWLEKEQLLDLGVTIRRLLSMSSEESAQHDPPAPSASAISLEFKLGQLSVGHDPDSSYFIIEAHDIEGDEEEAVLRVWSTRTQMEELSEEAFKICTAGRPICPLCGLAMDPTGHFCVRTNGHHESDILRQ